MSSVLSCLFSKSNPITIYHGKDGQNGKDGKDGTEIFKSFSQDDSNVYLTLTDGTVITIPKTPKLTIVLDVDPTNVKIAAGETITISYELKNASSNPVVTASSDGSFIVKLTRTTSTTGNITIKATYQSEDGYVNVMATDDTGRSTILVINLAYLGKYPMIFKVSATADNNYRASLPLHGDVDCIVDWGDGIVEQIKGTYNEGTWPNPHQYGSMVTDYTVKISGKVTWLCSYYSRSQIPYPSVTEVIQWGNTGLTSMICAFCGDDWLMVIADDNAAGFSNVTDFSYAFSDCSGLKGESPYTIINGKKVHLYERGKYPDYFVKPTSYGGCFRNCTKLTDYGSMPSGWKQ